MGDINHRPEEQLQDLEFCIDSNPPWDQTMILAFQNYILMLGTSVMIPTLLVPLMGGSYGDKARVIQTLLFVAGIKTLLQTLFGTRLPVIVGGSYAFVIPVLSIINDSSLKKIPDPHEVGECVEIGIPMLLTIIGFSLVHTDADWCVMQYLKHIKTWRDTPVLERFSILLSIAIIWLYSHILTVGGAYTYVPEKTKQSCRTDKAHLISSAPWIKFPYPLEWGAPTFSAGHSFAMMAAVIVSQIESTGAYIASSRFAMATPPPAYVLSRGIGWQGIGVLLDGLYGTVTGSTVSVENVGLLGLSRVGSRRVVQVSAGFMIFFSILASLGLSFLQFTNMNSMRNLYITGISLFLGLSVPQYFNQYWATSRHLPVYTRASWFDDFLNTVFTSAPTVALIVAVLLDNTVDVDVSRKDRGMPWWAKFRNFKGDIRNEEFYTLPFNLNRSLRLHMGGCDPLGDVTDGDLGQEPSRLKWSNGTNLS
ncbi:nucleobase-ascorbate transporter 1-like protein [Cinnamomum micranthum f. kanehirae]|uniref:Nucleobase-ascorbate transporter 1-like protein n=1 Tax=Cinnamomum micranthum f. kanehirae TaxID=337451 RepID=A0A443P8J4_9MAGN|nr:nucleobase-ascorbate transporter 1-like protein [Cinnamomum micranthum f. kanehirae]